MKSAILYAPRGGIELNENVVLDWYNNLYIELSEGGYADSEIKILSDPINYYGRFLNKKTNAYYRHHFIISIAKCLKFLLLENSSPRILDIGCGCGMQSLLMAMLGADVVAVDLNPAVIRVCKARKKFYEERLGRKLTISFVEGDILKQGRGEIGSFNGIYSLFAWDCINLQDALVEHISHLFEPGGRIALHNSNPSMWIRKIIKPRNRITREQLISLMSQKRINCVKTSGAVALPKELWALPPLNPFVEIVDRVLSKVINLSVSYIYMGVYEP